jgi:dihydrofolate synthase/folylpolyglutamate synthase
MSEVLERLLRRRRFGIKPGLDPEEELLEALGRPERSFAAVHVAGTNGKGSVCAMLAAVLQAAGYRTGLYTSPHLVRLNERFRVDGADIGDDELDALAQRVDETARELEHRTGRPLTFFECSTAMAFEHFRRRGVQLAVIEVGMGGRLDATNVLTGALSVITRIDMDHTAYLGHDLGAIAREKAGIIKPARPVVAGAMPEEALEVVERVAREAGSPLVLAGEAARVEFVAPDGGGQRVRLSTVSGDYGVLRLPLRGRHQLENLATAAAAVETLRDRVGLVVRDEALVAGLAATRWVGRFYEARQDPTR